MMAGQNIKKQYLMCQIPIKMLKQHAIPNSVLQILKIYSSRGAEKLVKDELYVWIIWIILIIYELFYLYELYYMNYKINYVILHACS